MEFQCRVIVQRRSAPSCGSPVESIPLQAERHSGRRQKLFAFPPESAFTFRPECCSESQRNGVQLQTGIAFTFDRIPQNSSRHIAMRIPAFLVNSPGSAKTSGAIGVGSNPIPLLRDRLISPVAMLILTSGFTCRPNRVTQSLTRSQGPAARNTFSANFSRNCA